MLRHVGPDSRSIVVPGCGMSFQTVGVKWWHAAACRSRQLAYSGGKLRHVGPDSRSIVMPGCGMSFQTVGVLWWQVAAGRSRQSESEVSP